jgi:hypothetical protein
MLQVHSHLSMMFENPASALLVHPKHCDDAKPGDSGYQRGVPVKLLLAESNKADATDYGEENREDGEPQIAVMTEVLDDLGILVPQAFL